MTLHEAYARGFDAGKNGPNTWNCHFAIFSTPQHTQEWERGKKSAELSKPAPPLGDGERA